MYMVFAFQYQCLSVSLSINFLKVKSFLLKVQTGRLGNVLRLNTLPSETETEDVL